MSTAASPITLLALCAACFFSGAAWKTQQHTKQAQAQQQAHARALQALSSKLEQSRAQQNHNCLNQRRNAGRGWHTPVDQRGDDLGMRLQA